MAERVGIILAGNTLAPALSTLRRLGFDVRREKPLGLVAESDRLIVHARSPVELLGLVKMFEIRGEHWTPTRDEVHELLRLQEIDSGASDRRAPSVERSVDIRAGRAGRRKAAAALWLAALGCMTAAYAGSSTERGIAFVQENAHMFPLIFGIGGAFAAILGLVLWSKRT